MASAFHLSDRFDKTLPHHGSISTLWNNMWRPAASKGVHPFADARVEDFEPIFVELEKKGINDGYLEEYTETFQPYGAALVKQAENAEKAGDTKIAEDLYLRAAAVYRIGRFPYIINEKQQKSWERQKKYYVKGSSLGQFPILEVDIPHVHALAGRDGSAIPAYLCLPKVQASVRLPLLLMINGLDGYRTESSAWTKFACCHGWALLSLEIPGTGDCPAAADDPLSPDRLFRSVLDWVKLDDRIDENNVVAWGRSTGAYYALRLAHVNAQQVKGAVVQGLGCHRVFEEEWLRHVDQFEYSFKLTPALTHKFGFDTLEDLIRDGKRKFSLIENGILDKAHARILLVNGIDDGIFPIEDSFLALERGGPKEARFVPGRTHMGVPESTPIIFRWLQETFEQLAYSYVS